MKSRIWTAANVAMLAMFVFSVAVQYNDPDPLPWMAIYAAAAVVCGFEIRRKTPLLAPVVVSMLTSMPDSHDDSVARPAVNR